jgi:flagellin
MFIQGIETSNMIAMNQKRLAGMQLDNSYEKLSTGLKVNKSADNPSGLAIGSGMNSQLHGITTAIGNVQEGILLVHTADSALSQIHDLLLREREISVKGANEAVQYTNVGASAGDIRPSSERSLFEELNSLEQELYKMTRRDNFNTKSVMFGFQIGQALQIGPDDDPNHRVQVIIPDIGALGTMVPIFAPGDTTHAQFVAAFRGQIDQCDADITKVADARAQVGVQEDNLNHALNTLVTQYQNISAAKSNIMDVDMANEIVNLTKIKIIDSTADSVSVIATSEKGIIDQLLTAVGLNGSQSK